MPSKAILCYICGWSHGSLHVYSWVGALVPGSSGGAGGGGKGVWLVDVDKTLSLCLWKVFVCTSVMYACCVYMCMHRG
jgi:hypothetical protein